MVSRAHLTSVFSYNSKGAGLHYLGPFLSNLSQLSDVRQKILDRERCVVERLLPFTDYQ